MYGSLTISSDRIMMNVVLHIRGPAVGRAATALIKHSQKSNCLAWTFDDAVSNDRETGNPLAGLSGLSRHSPWAKAEAQRPRRRWACPAKRGIGRKASLSCLSRASSRGAYRRNTRKRPEGCSYSGLEQPNHETS
jgi:hypothetical protein